MITETMLLFLGIAGVSDISRQNRSRMLLGHYYQIFEGRDLSWATEFIRRVIALENQKLTLDVHRAFFRWFYELRLIEGNANLESTLELANDLLQEKRLWLSIPMLHPDEQGVMREFLPFGIPHEFEITWVKAPYWAKSPCHLTLEVTPVDRGLFFIGGGRTKEYDKGPMITFQEER
jgi:hypothetical protein